MSVTATEVRAHVDAIRARMLAATARAGRDPAEIRLLAVTKGHGVEVARAACEAGLVDLGENYVQELVAKADACRDRPVRWHLIGPLQRNKVKMIVGRVALIHTLDSIPLADALAARAEAMGTTVDVLVQVNVGGEAQKHGVEPAGLRLVLEHASRLPRLVVRGLMTIPPFFDEPERARPHFRALRALRDEARRDFPKVSLDELSMGMSGDFEVAIEEGATIIRVGTALFGERLGTKG